MITHNFKEVGEGFPLILLHGNGEDYTYFTNQFEDFAKIYHVYALDTRGHGKTKRGEKEFSIRQFADDLKAFMDNHNIPKAHILGFSDGANIAMIFAMRYPDRVDRLILDGGNLKPHGVRYKYQIPIELEYIRLKFFAKKTAKNVHKLELYKLMVCDPNIPEQDLKKITAKTLVIAGDDDMISEKETRRIANNIPGAKLKIIEGDHFIAKKRPEIFNKIVIDFLNCE